ncbi:MAG: rubrerythrin [Anaerolineales bacterium]|nr:rubrerythrin family protein [Anaerolineae bacterium]PWB51131.1 MAG: rubrerythrin [Anaerolineales bacterium]
MSKTTDDLQAAFAGESQANRKYLAFAKKADAEGQPQVAKLFRAAAAAETVHAHSHLRALDGVGSTADNLKAAIAGENYEWVTMYPEFIQDAEAESAKRALTSFKFAFEVEKLHEQLYQKALNALEGEKPLPEVDYYVCPICGFTHEGPLDGICPICKTPASKFEKIN